MPLKLKKHNIAFGKALREFRRAKKKNQATLADEAGIDRTFVSLLELGERSPTLNTITALCAALQITLIELMTRVSELMETSADLGD